jgi:hypothetical protein
MILDHPQTKPQAGFLPRQGPQYALLSPLLGAGLPLAIVASLRASHVPQSTHAHPGGMLVPRSDSVSVSAPLPTDGFMQALVTQNGRLAWRQLRPATQVATSSGQLSTIAVSRWPNPAPLARLGADYMGSHAWGMADRCSYMSLWRPGRRGQPPGGSTS